MGEYQRCSLLIILRHILDDTDLNISGGPLKALRGASLPPPAGDCLFHLYCSPHNSGALAAVTELQQFACDHLITDSSQHFPERLQRRRMSNGMQGSRDRSVVAGLSRTAFRLRCSLTRLRPRRATTVDSFENDRCTLALPPPKDGSLALPTAASLPPHGSGTTSPALGVSMVKQLTWQLGQKWLPKHRSEDGSAKEGARLLVNDDPAKMLACELYVLFLNMDTWDTLDSTDSSAGRLAAELGAALKEGMPVLLLHECDRSRDGGGASFSLFLEKVHQPRCCNVGSTSTTVAQDRDIGTPSP